MSEAEELELLHRAGVAERAVDALGLADDRDPAVRWHYDQRRPALCEALGAHEAAEAIRRRASA